MTLTWQDGLALGIVLWAAAQVIRHVWRVVTLRKRLGCTAWRSCNAHTGSRQLIQITLPPKH